MCETNKYPKTESGTPHKGSCKFRKHPYSAALKRIHNQDPEQTGPLALARSFWRFSKGGLGTTGTCSHHLSGPKL